MEAGTNKDWTWGVIVLIILFAIIGFGAYSLYTGKSLAIIEVVLTALLLKFGTLIDFKYGSSKGSKEKTELLAEKEKAPEAIVPEAAAQKTYPDTSTDVKTGIV